MKSKMPDENRLLLILRDWENQGLTLSLEGDKIRPSRAVELDERELIVQHRELIMSLIPKMTFRTKAECRPDLRAWYEASKAKFKLRGVIHVEETTNTGESD